MTPTPTYARHATCKRVLDGDTFEMDVKGSFGHHADVHLRLRGIDTPEASTPEGKDAARFVVALLQPNGVPAPLVVETFRTRTGADLRTLARYVADVWLPDGTSLADRLRDAGHIKPTT